jgi:hypothetical protein
MRVNIRGYITHKEAETYSDCADRYAINTKNNRFAVSDGVSKSFFPDYWADILVKHFVALEKDSELSIDECQSEWLDEVTKKVNTPEVKWYTQNAFCKKDPGLATFVTLRFEKDKWFADALGDSFLFFVPNETTTGFDDWVKLSSKPEPVVFDSFPDYFSSRNNQHGESKKIEHPLVAGTFYLMTDALSEWVFNKKEKAIDEIKEKWKNQDEFERSVTELRRLTELNNDDSAILIIEVENDEKNELTYNKTEVQSLSELIEKEKSAGKELVEGRKENFIEEAKEGLTNTTPEVKTDEPEDKKESFTEAKGDLPNINLEVKTEEPEDKKGTTNQSLNESRENYLKELRKLNPDEQKEELINLCKEYGISVTN